LSTGLSLVKNILSNFNSCIFEPPQPISSHFMDVPISFSHSYFFVGFLLNIFFNMYFLYIYICFYFLCGNLKMGNNKELPPLFFWIFGLLPLPPEGASPLSQESPLPNLFSLRWPNGLPLFWPKPESQKNKPHTLSSPSLHRSHLSFPFS
jgi:hypothetical protein